MTEDTRKDRRAKIVSLNVRYKSATVDEFIENHSHDVSKGGLFIKTPTPFAPGTLIKFEIRIANDRAVITGVGRVVWKREPSQAAGERPSGMGVKFIKIDDSSRQLIDRIVAEKEGAGAAFAYEQDDGSVRAATRPISDRPNVVEAAKPGSLRPGEVRKETIMGIGASTPPPPKAAGGGMFPTTTSAPEEGPVKEKTVMKQAAELLEEALREAGGSMEEIGSNPLFEGNRPGLSAKSTLVGIPSPATHGSAPPQAKPRSEPPRPEMVATRISEAPATPANIAPSAPPPDARMKSDAPRKISAPPPTAKETPSAKTALEEPAPTSRQRKTDPPAAPRARAVPVVPEAPRSNGGMIWVFLIAIVAGGVAFVYKDSLFGPEAAAPSGSAPATTATAPPAATTAPTATTAQTTAPTATAAPTVTATTTTTATATPPAATQTAAPAATQTATATAAATAAPTPAPPPAPKPTATSAPLSTATAAPTPPPAPRPAPAPKPVATAAPESAPAAEPAATAAPKPKGKPKSGGDEAKPAAGADDNPY
jgi:uncharacterized protein (TIGR02266 family)